MIIFVDNVIININFTKEN